MTHEDAIQTYAAERYLLREMTEDEQGIFEEHFFDCADCAADVTDGTRMMIAGRDVVGPPKVLPMPHPKPKPPRWWNLPAAAAASLILPLLGGGVGYRLAMNQRHEPTELVQVAWLETGVSRAATTTAVPAVRPGDELRFDVGSHDDAVKYDLVVECGGKTESTHGISREMAAEAVTLRIGELPAGRCELEIQGVRKDGKRFWISSSPFKVGER